MIKVGLQQSTWHQSSGLPTSTFLKKLYPVLWIFWIMIIYLVILCILMYKFLSFFRSFSHSPASLLGHFVTFEAKMFGKIIRSKYIKNNLSPTSPDFGNVQKKIIIVIWGRLYVTRCAPILRRTSKVYFDRNRARAELKWSRIGNEIFISKSNKT